LCPLIVNSIVLYGGAVITVRARFLGCKVTSSAEPTCELEAGMELVK
jgi:hypothetical protein